MRINREKIVALLGLLVLVIGLLEVVQTIVAPTRGIEVVSYSTPGGGREILPRAYRMYTEESPTGRNPFSFSEGWERLDVLPMEPPPLPPAGRPIPGLGFSPSALDVGFLFEGTPAASAGSTTTSATSKTGGAGG